MYFPCIKCGSQRLLVRGMCELCAPNIHADYQASLQAYDRAATVFFAKTGKEPLQDWRGFETWCDVEGITFDQ